MTRDERLFRNAVIVYAIVEALVLAALIVAKLKGH
jgi:F0F1-type ATP synthase membrane subunit c/vacuolar-type H+-ATPase subunit K